MQPEKNTPPEQEPTVLDFYKTATKDWASFSNFIRSLWDARQREEFNQSLALEATHPVILKSAEEPERTTVFPWRAVAAFGLALVAQFLVEPPLRNGLLSVVLYMAAFGVAFWSYRSARATNGTVHVINGVLRPLDLVGLFPND